MIEAVQLVAVRGQIAVQSLLADGGSQPSDIDPSTGKGAEWGKGAPIGLLVIVVLCIAGYFLARSMSKHIRKVQGKTSFDADTDTVIDPADASEPGRDATDRTDTDQTAGTS